MPRTARKPIQTSLMDGSISFNHGRIRGGGLVVLARTLEQAVPLAGLRRRIRIGSKAFFRRTWAAFAIGPRIAHGLTNEGKISPYCPGDKDGAMDERDLPGPGSGLASVAIKEWQAVRWSSMPGPAMPNSVEDRPRYQEEGSPPRWPWIGATIIPTRVVIKGGAWQDASSWDAAPHGSGQAHPEKVLEVLAEATWTHAEQGVRRSRNRPGGVPAEGRSSP